MIRLSGRSFSLLLALLAFASANLFAQSFDTLVMPGKISEAHAKIEKECKKCHLPFKRTEQSGLCMDCHKDTAKDVKTKRGFHGVSPDVNGKECKSCHAEHKGREAKIAVFDQKKFNHSHTGFAVDNAHAKIECDSCHKSGKKFREVTSTCVSCHNKDDKHKNSLGEKCEACHNDVSWKEAKFDHSKTRFALTGKHNTAKCDTCHANNRYKDTPRTCLACHKKDDTHKGRYGQKCETCHNATDWKNQFNHEKQGHYALLGKHATAKCETCHKAPLYTEKLGTKCMSCHKADDVHKGSLGDKCEKCHNERGWKTTSFDHTRDTKFPLANKHKSAKCESCHTKGVTVKLETTCLACHLKNDDHKGTYGKECQTCHNDAAWKPSTFNHAKTSKYTLRDAHAKIKCDACHGTGKLFVKDGAKPLKMECLACHKKDDKHAGQLGERCESCHNEKKWDGIGYDHNKSRFPLTGAHYKVECKLCHLTPKFKDASVICGTCHRKEDVHKQTLGNRCETCHNTRNWNSWDFDHTKQTSYLLDGAHSKVKCSACHRVAVALSDTKTLAAPLSKMCFGCHNGDDTHHGGFGQLCERCHITQDWKKVKLGTARH